MTLPTHIEKYWGKAQPKDGARQTWHPLAYHSLDVAAVADALMRRDSVRLARLARSMGVEAYSLRSILVLLIALHDIGKFSRHFQAKSTLGPLGNLPPPPPRVRHDAIGYAMFDCLDFDLEPLLSPYFDWMSDGPDLFAAVAGHHGSPPGSVKGSWLDGFENDEPHDVRAFVTDVIEILQPLGKLPRLGRGSKLLSWSLAGLTNLSDWIGSNSNRFLYTPPIYSLRDYWEKITPEADAAVEETGILPVASPAIVDATTLLAHITGALSPLQQCARDVALPAGPSLTMIEDVTGAGKTEAALLIAARHLAEGRASGIFFALPTMATANAMYDRLAVSYRRLFAERSVASLVLAHGRRSLNDGFRDSILERAGAQDRPEARSYGRNETAADETATAACSAWIADDRRKAFLAHVGVGTIDQAVLGVLPSRFQALRLWGLADRVLIIDEAHAYDSYVSRELETLLEFQAALGGSAVVLSATLSKLARDRLASAYARGLGSRQASVTDDSYPLVSVISERGVASIPVATRPELARTLAVKRVSAIEDAVRHATNLATRGATVAWIRNTVDDAIAAADRLSAEGLEPILLHARFAMCDRLDIEEQVKTLLGKESTPALRRDRNRNGVVVVGSQILEASLDYDVDGMICDCAPIDAIVQRAGRLWRHPHRNTERPIGDDGRVLLLLSPDPAAVANADWYRAGISNGAAAVYSDHGYVWRSAKVLDDLGAITTPGGLRKIMSCVYDDDVAMRIPDALQRASLDADGKRCATRSVAALASLDVSQGYLGNDQHFARDDIVQTRLGEPVTVFRLARVEGGAVVPWCSLEAAGGSLARAWALSDCSVRQKMATGVPQPSGEMAKAIHDAKLQWPEWEREQPLVVLNPLDNGIFSGRVLKDKEEREVVYDRLLGWRIAPA